MLYSTVLKSFLVITVACAPAQALAPKPVGASGVLDVSEAHQDPYATNPYAVDMSPPPGSPPPSPPVPPPAPCEGKQVDEDCIDTTFANGGYCARDDNSDIGLKCSPKRPCQPAKKDDDCTTDSIEDGFCEDDAMGGLRCHKKPACKGKSSGDDCKDDWIEDGYCKDMSYPYPDMPSMYCHMKGPCYKKAHGDDCTASWFKEGEEGFCVVTDSYDYCQQKGPCYDSHAGDKCEDHYYKYNYATRKNEKKDIEGICVDRDDCPTQSWARNPCGGWHGPKQMRCQKPLPCQDKEEGDSCAEEWMQNANPPKEGYCVKSLWSSESGWKALNCMEKNTCYGKEEDSACKLSYKMMKYEPTTEKYFNVTQGFCKKEAKGSIYMYCMSPNTCDKKEPGDPCFDCHAWKYNGVTNHNCYPSEDPEDGECVSNTYDEGTPKERTYSYCKKKGYEVVAGQEFNGYPPEIAKIMKMQMHV